jgi:23S rRNA (cytosine1962-C5)-methyltransferase
VPKVILLPGHVQPVWAGHPWVYAQAVARVEGGATPGDVVDVTDPKGQWMGRGLYSPRTAIVVRLLSRQPNVAIDAQFFAERIECAVKRRAMLGLPSERSNGYRVVNAEGDDLPGLIVDRFGDVAVVQFGTLGMKLREGILLDAIQNTLGVHTIIDRTSERLATLEGFQAERSVVRGSLSEQELSFLERGFTYRIPLELSQKTGFYFDQRSLRGRVEQLATNRRVLDAFCYVGSFALAAARGGASEVVAVDTNAMALQVAASVAADNGLGERIRYEHGNARELLARAGNGSRYDLVLCDPPKLSPSRSSWKQASTTMRSLAAAACRATSPGGLLVLSSCSASLGVDELTRALALGARDVGVIPRVIERWFQGPDHPVPAAFNEGLYLSSLIAIIDRAG